jgi:hypothetical protein
MNDVWFGSVHVSVVNEIFPTDFYEVPNQYFIPSIKLQLPPSALQVPPYVLQIPPQHVYAYRCGQECLTPSALHEEEEIFF